MSFIARVYPVGWPAAQVTMRGEGPWDDGLVVDGDGFTGWNGGVGSHRDVTMRQNRRGARPVRSYGDPREVRINGFANASSHEALGSLEERFSLIGGDDVQEVKFVVEEMGRTRWAIGYVDIAGFIPDGTIPSAQFSLHLWFENALKFGEDHTSGPAASTNMPNYGNTTASLVHTITGANAGGYTLTSGGKTFTVTQPLVSGIPHTVDMETGELIVAGVVISGKTAPSDLWGVPGGGQVTTTVTGGTAALTTAAKDTYS